MPRKLIDGERGHGSLTGVWEGRSAPFPLPDGTMPAEARCQSDRGINPPMKTRDILP